MKCTTKVTNESQINLVYVSCSNYYVYKSWPVFIEIHYMLHIFSKVLKHHFINV